MSNLKFLIGENGTIFKTTYNSDPNAKINIIVIGGSKGGISGPGNLYSNLIQNTDEKSFYNILRINIAQNGTTDFDSAVGILMTGIDWILNQNQLSIILCGWSMGGAIITHAYLNLLDTPEKSDRITKLIYFATTSNRMDSAEKILIPKVFFHGKKDKSVSSTVSEKFSDKLINAKLFIYDTDHYFANKKSELLEDFINEIKL
jgi:alpha/beta superfamily hydrolase